MSWFRRFLLLACEHRMAFEHLYNSISSKVKSLRFGDLIRSRARGSKSQHGTERPIPRYHRSPPSFVTTPTIIRTSELLLVAIAESATSCTLRMVAKITRLCAGSCGRKLFGTSNAGSLFSRLSSSFAVIELHEQAGTQPPTRSPKQRSVLQYSAFMFEGMVIVDCG